MAKKPSKKTLRRKADTLFSKITRKKHPKCQRCGKPATQIHHIYSRRHLTIRYDEDNVISCCSSCHFFVHQNPLDFTEWITQVRGKVWRENLKEKRDMYMKIDYEQILERLEYGI